jgi:predicted phosphate transport protein (TIGR00153 family)
VAWIDKLVGRSPIGPMQDHMRAAVQCAKEILPLVDAMASGDLDAIRERRAEIDRLEHEADEIKHGIRSHLPRRLMLAMERRDMLEILDSQDSIADVTQDIAELADQRGMQLPPALVEPIQALATRVVAACDQAQRIIDELDELLETGFAGREVSRVEEMIEELGRIESDTDSLQDQSCRTLFAMESELGVATVYWHQIILWVANVADHAERVGNRLRLLIAS